MRISKEITNSGLYSFEITKDNYPFWGVSYLNKGMNTTTLLLFDGINGKLISTHNAKIQILTDDYGGQKQYYLQEYLKSEKYSIQQDSIWNEINK